MADNSWEKIAKVFERGIAEKLHLGCQLYVSRGGKAIGDFALGDAAPGRPMQNASLMHWLSSGKPITAVAIAQLVERGLLSFDDQISVVIPEFSQGGKEQMTIRHLLTHTGGFRAADRLRESLSWDEMIEGICRTPIEPDWIPGAKAGYHIHGAWFILAEIVQRRSGAQFSDCVQREIFQPLGMENSWIGMPPKIYEATVHLRSVMHVFDSEKLVPHPAWNSEASWMQCRPGSNARGPIADLARFYESLLGHGPQILKRETIQLMTRRHRVGLFDQTFQHIIDFGLGFIINSNRYGATTVPYGFGPLASEETFGHSGSQSSCAFADPAHDLVVAWACNGMPGDGRHQQRVRQINTAIYQELGLAR